jgi:hypothetical protein
MKISYAILLKQSGILPGRAVSGVCYPGFMVTGEHCISALAIGLKKLFGSGFSVHEEKFVKCYQELIEELCLKYFPIIFKRCKTPSINSEIV